MQLKPEDLPSTPRQEYADAAPDIQMIADELAGTRQMHANHRLYIHKYKGEKPEGYKRRATAAKFYGGLSRTLSASTGMLFAKPPVKSKDWQPEIATHWENIDGKGTHGDVFTKRRADDGLAYGMLAILVDFSPAPEVPVVTAKTEQDLNLRPKWAAYSRADIISWRTASVNNVETLTQVVLREGGSSNVGKFGVAKKLLYRVCTLTDAGAAWELLEEVRDASGTVTVQSRGVGTFTNKTGQQAPFIPLSVGYTGRTDAMFCARPPLLDVAWANLEHWRVATNLRYYEDLACFPQPTVEGEIAKDANGLAVPLALGPSVMVNVTAGSKFTWTEVSGSSIAALRESLAEKKDEIGELGASFLSRKTRGVETAEAKRLDATAENSTLATAAQGIQDCIDQALMFHAWYLGIDAAAAPTLTINTDFDAQQMDAQTMMAYVAAVKDAGVPPRVMLEQWQAGGRIGPDVDIEALEAEMLVGLEAAKAKNAVTPPADPLDKAA